MKLWVDPWAGLKFPGDVGNTAAEIKVSSESEIQDKLKSILSDWPPLENLLFRSRGSATMKSVEIICCLFIVIFALAVAHPLPDNVLEQVETKEEPSKPALLFEDPTVPALAQKAPSRPALVLKDPSRPALVLKDPTVPALLLKDPSKPALLEKDPTAPADLQELPADDNALSSDMSQDDPQEQQDSEAIMFSQEALEVIFNDIPQENELQKEE